MTQAYTFSTFALKSRYICTVLLKCCTGGCGFKKRALRDYTAPDESCLSLTEGEIITNVSVIDDDWAEGQNFNDRTGRFPLSHSEVSLP